MSDPDFRLCDHNREPEDCIQCVRDQLAKAVSERGTLLDLLAPVEGLLMYEDAAIQNFAERRDPCPTVQTGPRKWLNRIRSAHANIPTSLKMLR